MLIIYGEKTEFYQWDIDQKLIVQDTSINEVHFCNQTDDCSLICEVYEEDGNRFVNVPNILLTEAYPIRVYAICDGAVKMSMMFSVKARSKPADYIYTETEVRNWQEIVRRLEEIELSAGGTVEVDELPTEDISNKILYRIGENVYYYAGEWLRMATDKDIEILSKAVDALSENKQDNLSFDGEYNAEANKVATKSTVSSAVRAEEDRAKGEEKTISDKLSVVESIAKGANQAISYPSYRDMLLGNNEREGLLALDSKVLNIGQSILIGTKKVPDLWVSRYIKPQAEYVYESEEEIANRLKTDGRIYIGFYELYPLETQKVNLDDYAKKETVDLAVGIAGEARGTAVEVKTKVETNIVPTLEGKVADEETRAKGAEEALSIAIGDMAKEVENNILPKIVNANYAENDSNNPSYIENRPFYDGRTVAEDNIERGEFDFSFYADPDGSIYKFSDRTVTREELFAEGAEYKVEGIYKDWTTDGKEQTVALNLTTDNIVSEDDSGLVINIRQNNRGYKFYIIYDCTAFSLNCYTGTFVAPSEGIYYYDNVGTGNSRINRLYRDSVGEIQKLDNKFLDLPSNPDFFALKSEVEVVEGIAKGANQAKTFVDYETMIAELNSHDEKEKCVYNDGQNIYIATLEVPDLWIGGKFENYQEYWYGTDAEFTAQLKANGFVQVGYYALCALETQKVDLDGYVPKPATNNAGDSVLIYTGKNSTNEYRQATASADNGIAIYAPTGAAPALGVNPATRAQILGKNYARKPICTDQLDYAIKVGLTTNKETLTDEDKAKAQKWLGIEAGNFLDISGEVTDNSDSINFSISGTEITLYKVSDKLPNSLVGAKVYGTYSGVPYEQTIGESAEVHHLLDLAGNQIGWYIDCSLGYIVVVESATVGVIGNGRINFQSTGVYLTQCPKLTKYLQSIEYSLVLDNKYLDLSDCLLKSESANAVKDALTDNPAEWTDDTTDENGELVKGDKTKARELIGAASASKLDEVEEMANSASKVLAADDYEALITQMRGWEIGQYKVGQYIHICDSEVPDLCVSYVWSSEQDYDDSYEYTTDEQFIQDNKDNGEVRIGYYSVQMLNGDVRPIEEMYLDIFLTNGSQGLEYEFTDDGISGSCTGYGIADTDIEIASIVRGIPITKVANSAFYKSKIIGVVIPDSITAIGTRAFEDSLELTTINIPDSVNNIGEMAFCHCEGLTNVTIGSGVSRISDGMFQHCYSLTHIEIPNNVFSIGYDAFNWCDSLVSVTIGNGVSVIREGAFSFCEKLTDVYYGGTRAEWNTLVANIESGNEPLTAANIHCEGEV